MFGCVVLISSLVAMLKLTFIIKVLCRCFRKRLVNRLGGRTICVSENIRDAKASCLGGLGSRSSEVACISRDKGIVCSGRTGIRDVSGRKRHGRVHRTRVGKRNTSREVSSALSRGAVCCTMHLRGNGILEISDGRTSM